MQEIITLIVFPGFSVLYPTRRYAGIMFAAFACLVLAGYFTFSRW